MGHSSPLFVILRAVKSSVFVKKSGLTKAKENVEQNFFRAPEPKVYINDIIMIEK